MNRDNFARRFDLSVRVLISPGYLLREQFRRPEPPPRPIREPCRKEVALPLQGEGETVSGSGLGTSSPRVSGGRAGPFSAGGGSAVSPDGRSSDTPGVGTTPAGANTTGPALGAGTSTTPATPGGGKQHSGDNSRRRNDHAPHTSWFECSERGTEHRVIIGHVYAGKLEPWFDAIESGDRIGSDANEFLFAHLYESNGAAPEFKRHEPFWSLDLQRGKGFFLKRNKALPAVPERC